MEHETLESAKNVGEPFVIGGWQVDPASLRISNAKQTIKLEPKTMAVLDYLACRPNTVVSRQELEDTIWAGTIVGYDSLGNSITKLRKALGDNAREPHIIETIAKSGYRLIAEVCIDDPAEPASVSTAAPEPNVMPAVKPIHRGWPVVSAIAVALILIIGFTFWWQTRLPEVGPVSEDEMDYPLSDKPSIAVLPFTNISNDAEQDYFAVGMTVDLITDISQFSELFVIAYNSVKDYKDKSIKIRQVAKELGVRFVMEGNVRRLENQVRINVQLIDAIEGNLVWAKRYDGSLDDIFSMQDKIAQRIVTALLNTLTGREQGKITQIETNNPEAYDTYLRGWERYRLGAPGDLAKAINYFEQAIKLDPDYARAHSALAVAHWKISLNGWSRSIGLLPFQAREQSRLSLKKAMEQPFALTHQVASEKAAYFRRKPDRALAEAELAISLDANDPAGHLAMSTAMLKANRANEAVKSVRTAMRLDPYYPAFYLSRLGQAQYALGQYEKASASFKEAARRNPDDEWNFVYSVATYGQLGLEAEAAQAVEKANALRAKSGWGSLTTRTAQIEWRGGRRYYFKWFGDYKPLREGLRKAGVKTEANWRGLISMGASGLEVKGARTVDAQTAKTLHNRGVPFVDVWFFWLRNHVPGAYYLDVWSYEFNDARLPQIVSKTQEVVIYSSRDNDDHWVQEAVARAVTWGFEKVYYFRDGLDGWKAAGYPVETGK